MAGTKAGGVKCREKNYEKFGPDFYRTIGKAGGQAKVPKGFALMTPEKRKAAGKLGGERSRKGAHNREDNMGKEATLKPGQDILQNESDSKRRRSFWIFRHKG